MDYYKVKYLEIEMLLTKVFYIKSIKNPDYNPILLLLNLRQLNILFQPFTMNLSAWEDHTLLTTS